MKYKPERDLADFAREYKTLSPSKLADIVLMRRNKKVTPESITMWFSRHVDVMDKLNKEIVAGLPTAKEEVDLTIFNTGNFETLQTVKDWLIMLHNRELTPLYIAQKINVLKNVCLGRIHTFDLVAEGKWSYKHPDRFHLQDAMEMIALLRARGIDTYMYKRDLKDFLECKGEPVGKKITVGRARGFGTYAKLFVEKTVLSKMLTSIREQNYEAYVADRFMYKTATRVSATLASAIEELKEIGNRAILRVFDKGRISMYPRGHPWNKYIDPALLAELKTLIGDRKHGKIFSIAEDKLATINKLAIQRFCPEVLEQFPDVMPNHFWRHMFAQHMLRNTNWNYAIVASLGGWTVDSLEESYGKPPDELVQQWAKEVHIED